MKSLCILIVLLLSGSGWGQSVGPGAVATTSATRSASVIPKETTGQTQTDDFNRADNPDLGANWTPVQSTMVISGNAATYSGVGSDACERYSAVTWGDNQSSEVKVTAGTTGPGEGIGVAVRCSASAITFYRLVINGDGEWEVGRMVASAFTSMASGTTTFSSGAVLKISAVGTTITCTYNGSQIDSRSDANISSGSPGICYSANMATASVDDWIGQDGL